MKLCHLLEDYIARSLNDERTREFELHLGSCDLCRMEVEHARDLFLTLREASEQLEQCPPQLTIVPLPVRNPAQASHRPRPSAITAMVVSVVVACAAVLAVVWTQDNSAEIAEPAQRRTSGTALVVATNLPSPEVRVVGMAAETLACEDPNIRIVLLFPE